MRVLRPELLEFIARPEEIIEPSLQTVGVFWWLQIIVYVAAQLVFKQVRLDPCRSRERAQNAFAFSFHLALIDP